MVKHVKIDEHDRARMLDHIVFQVLSDILRFDKRWPLQASMQDLATLHAISCCANASPGTRVFAREMWDQLACPGAEASGKAALKDALKRWRQNETALLGHHR